MKQFRQILFTAVLLCIAVPVIAQKKRHITVTDHKDFYQLLREANLSFKLPPGFKEIPAVNDEDFSFDFAMEMPNKDFEMWLQVKSQKQNWNSYESNPALANPDSMYKDMSKAIAITLSGDTSYLVRNMPPEILTRYNADDGKSYLINLLDTRVTKHYKYALIIALEKNHTGTMVAIYFTNQKDPDFYRDVSRAGNCIKFVPPLTN